MDVIATHVNADFDCLGSMIAARKLYPEAILVFPGGQDRGLRHFLIQSTLYAYNIQRLQEINLEEITRLILVDVRNLKRIGALADIVHKPGLEIHVYDHHPQDANSVQGSFEDIQNVGATTTILTKIFQRKGIAPDPEEATMMMLGIFEDTGHLLFNSTTADDYHAAAFLLEHGANLNTVADFLVREMTHEQVSLLNELLTSRRSKLINGIEISIAHASVDYYVGDISSLVHKLKDIENLDILIVVVRMEDRIFMVGRSRLPELHVGEMFQELGGGGHSYAASATVRDMPLAQALDAIQLLLEKHVRSAVFARDLMSSPVMTLVEEDSVKTARQLMTRFNFNAVPIVNADRSVVGIVTRQIVEKTVYHRLAKLQVAEVMTSDFRTVSPDASLGELKQAIIEFNQRCLPVIDAGELVGVVTRTDLLKHLLAGQDVGIESRGEVLQKRRGELKRKNLKNMIEAQLPAHAQDLLFQLGAVADREGFKIFLVGGIVRDLLLRKPNLDIDIVVEGDGIAFAQRFAKSTSCRVRPHEKFGTAVIVFPDGFKVDVASARLEYYDAPASLPKIEYASIRHDLARRDFTINTLMVGLNHESYGQMIDFFGGQRDLKDKAIRVLHNLSFIEDPTRLFRAVRFEQRLGFKIGAQTERLMKSAVRMNLVKRLGGVRILNELELILSEAHILPALERLHQFDLIKFVDRKIKFDQACRQLLIAAGRASNWFDLLYTGESYHRWQLYLLCLFDRQSESSVKKTVEWLNITGGDQTMFVDQRSYALRLLKQFRQNRKGQGAPENSQLFQWLSGLRLEILLFMMAAAPDDDVRKWLSRFVNRLRHTRIVLDGGDLIALGLAPGHRFRQIFKVLLDARLDGLVETKADELALVRQRFLSSDIAG